MVTADGVGVSTSTLPTRPIVFGGNGIVIVANWDRNVAPLALNKLFLFVLGEVVTCEMSTSSGCSIPCVSSHLATNVVVNVVAGDV